MRATDRLVRGSLTSLTACLAAVLLCGATAAADAPRKGSAQYRARCTVPGALNCAKLRVEVPRAITKVCIARAGRRLCVTTPRSRNASFSLSRGRRIRVGKRLAITVYAAGRRPRSLTRTVLATAPAPAPAAAPAPVASSSSSGANSKGPAAVVAPQPAACNGRSVPSTAAPGPGITTSDSAFDGAPAYFEIGAPAGPFTGQQPRGVALVLHGGGWAANGPGAVQAQRAMADRWRARGWTTVNATYRPCGDSLGDALSFHDRIRTRWGLTIPVCTTGESAGGHLALLVAALRDNVACAISEAGPTDLEAIASQSAYDRKTGGQSLDAGRWIREIGGAAFGADKLGLVSVVARASSLTDTRILQGFAQNDWLISPLQATTLEAAVKAADPGAHVATDLMAPGPVEFVHGAVTQAAIDDFRVREGQLIAAVAP